MLAALHCRKYLQDSSRETCVWLEGWMKKKKQRETATPKQTYSKTQHLLQEVGPCFISEKTDISLNRVVLTALLICRFPSNCQQTSLIIYVQRTACLCLDDHLYVERVHVKV